MKKLIFAAVAMLLCLTLAACPGVETTMTYTFTVTTGDNISIQLQTGDGYKLHQKDGDFSVSKDDETIFNGSFYFADAFLANKDAIRESADRCEDIENGLFYQYTDEAGLENEFVVVVPGSNTAVVVTSPADEAAAKAAFERLSFKVAD